MIGRLRGAVVSLEPNLAVLDVGGVGYEVQIPLGTFYVLSRRDGETVTLHVHTHVREDALQLFGFASLDERRAFGRCLKVSGVGPRLALAVLSGIGAEELERAVLSGDRARLQSIPGVGRKTAERLLLELRDRFADERPRRAAGRAAADEGAGAEGDAVSALTNLGFAAEASRRAVAESLRSLGQDVGLEPLLKASLARLVR